jgi:hypothetical protein
VNEKSCWTPKCRIPRACAVHWSDRDVSLGPEIRGVSRQSLQRYARGLYADCHHSQSLAKPPVKNISMTALRGVGGIQRR